MSDIIGDAYAFGLFAPLSGEAKRDRALAANAERVREGAGGDVLVARVTARLLDRASFTADDVAALLDEMGVDKDLVTRRRVTSVIVNAGKGRHWDADGYESSRDARRNARPVTRWRVRAA